MGGPRCFVLGPEEGADSRDRSLRMALADLTAGMKRRDEMGWHWRVEALLGNTMEQYTTLVPLQQSQTQFGGPEDVLNMLVTAEEPSRAELLEAIRAPR
ncbi:hypothetical protein NDU88_002636 [Pleurodeles waltl]|uniref:Uncharacterized protein n=1 Tax=Pleurodeles waltl TaxID=8319 RepID=A0AAV7WQR8_PLEWA|nr:hypothetical protein NDU88_002636 [Pleurodeles waltl]